MLSPIHTRIRHLRRYQELAQVMVRHGFDGVADLLGLRHWLALPMRLAGSRLEESVSAAVHLRLAAEELGPTFIKLGQMLSTRPDLLPPEYLLELSQLRDNVPPFSFEKAQEIIESELGAPLTDLFASFEATPLAAASLGQVHGAVLRDGSEVVVKVLRPNIREIVRLDLDILFEMARLAEERTALGRSYPLVELADEFSVTLRSELDYLHEARNAERFRRNFVGRSELYIPKVYWDFTTHDVLTLERLRGVTIDNVDGLRAAGLDPRRVAVNAIDLIMKEIFEDGFFHADPHPGNLFVLEGNVIGAMDFGMVGYLDKGTKEQLMRLFVAAISHDVAGMVDEMVQMEMVGTSVDHRRLTRDMSRLLDKYRDVPLKDLTIREVFNDVLPIAFRHRLTLPSNLWMLGKVLVMVEGTGQLLSPDLDVFELAKPHAIQGMAQINSPRAWAERFGRGASNWSELWFMLPQRLPRMLDRLGKGELVLGLDVVNTRTILNRLDRVVNRLSVSILIAALIVGLGLLTSRFTSADGRTLAVILLAVGFVVSVGLGSWLVWSMWRSGRH
jgi:ubiquinone biosynthesis protein